MKNRTFAAIAFSALCLPVPSYAADSFIGNSLGSAPYVTADIDKDAAKAVDSFLESLTGAKPFFEERLRSEFVQKDRQRYDNASAVTLRSLFGFETAPYQSLRIALAGSNTMQIGSTLYNDGINGNTKYPTIGDPHDTQLQLANATWTGLPNTSVTAGRQYLVIDNQRFVGTSNWRQNRQTFDAATIKNSPMADLELLYSFVFGLNRSPGTRSALGTYRMQSHLLHATYTGVPGLKLSAYSYLTDVFKYENLSSATTGLRAEYQRPIDDRWSATGVAEYARQSDFGNATKSFSLNYYTVEPGIKWQPTKAVTLTQKAGYEVLGSDGRVAVQTPMASMHTQNGWGDIFSTTPTNGLEDTYSKSALRYKMPFEDLGQAKLQVEWHSFRASNSSAHYGNEWDVSLSQGFLDYFTAQLDYAAYHADTYSTNTQKVMATLLFQY